MTPVEVRIVLVIASANEPSVQVDRFDQPLENQIKVRFDNRSLPLILALPRRIEMASTDVNTCRTRAIEIVEALSSKKFTVDPAAADLGTSGHCWRDGSWSTVGCGFVHVFEIRQYDSAGTVAPWVETMMFIGGDPSKNLRGQFYVVFQEPGS